MSYCGGSECILFVDNEEPDCQLGQQMLMHLGYEVVARTSGWEALEIFLETPNRFDLVITDLSMPNITGRMLASELLRIRPDIPLIFCAGRGQKVSEEQTKGVKGLLLKPYTIRDTASTIRHVLDQAVKAGSW